MIEQILEVCREQGSAGRTKYEVLGKMMEEVGETAVEVMIKQGFIKNKKAGVDGVIGECCDVIITAVDLIYIDNPWIRSEEISDIIKTKLDKWQGKRVDPLEYFPDEGREELRQKLINNCEEMLAKLKSGAPIENLIK